MSDLKLRRMAAGISGSVLCAKANISRSRLSLIEHEYISPGAEEVSRINSALDQLIQAKSVIDNVAASLGWPVGARRRDQ
jgi:transcriptional regulator with XRE-family HTH domain